MQTEDYPSFKRILVGMARMYGSDPDGAVLDAYWLALKGWALPEFEEAAAHLMRTSKFMPRPADFSELRKAEDASPAESWCAVLAAVRRARPFEEITVDERADRVVRALGGYRALAQTHSEDMHFREKRFAELWEELGEVDETRKALPFLNAGAHNGPRSLFASVKVADTFERQEKQVVPRKSRA